MRASVYCTLFNSLYLTRGVMMIRSLIRESQIPPKVYVFCFDDRTFQIMNQLKLPGVILIELSQLENPALLSAKSTRSTGEYCWTCTPQVLLYVLKNFDEEICTYIDADLYFYQDPSVAIPSSADELVLITEHRYTPRYDQTDSAGRFCVQFLTFKKEKRSLRLLETWALQCLEWCFDRVEDGKFGDQKYLDRWPSEGKWVKVADDPRVGVAPWNVQQLSEVQKSSKDFPLFYHFHGVRWLASDEVFLGGYELKAWVIASLYTPYIEEWVKTAVEFDQRFSLPVFRSPVPGNRLKFILKRWIFWHKFIKVTPWLR